MRQYGIFTAGQNSFADGVRIQVVGIYFFNEDIKLDIADMDRADSCSHVGTLKSSSTWLVSQTHDHLG